MQLKQEGETNQIMQALVVQFEFNLNLIGSGKLPFQAIFKWLVYLLYIYEMSVLNYTWYRNMK